jgi:hypothetical protein
LDVQADHSVASILVGITAHPATGSFAPGTFSYTPDQMREIIKTFLDLADSYRNSLVNAHAMANVEAPGLEFASAFHAADARAMGEDYLRSIHDSWQYCLTQAQKFQDTLDGYTGLEHHSVAQLNQAGAPDDQSAPQAGV